MSIYNPQAPHPFDPDSPLYEEMVDSGRIRREPPYGHTVTCQASVQVRGSLGGSLTPYYTRCGEPIAAISIRGGIGQHYCLEHGQESQDRGASVHYHCSSCLTDVRWPSELQPGTGRCRECLT